MIKSKLVQFWQKAAIDLGLNLTVNYKIKLDSGEDISALYRLKSKPKI